MRRLVIVLFILFNLFVIVGCRDDQLVKSIVDGSGVDDVEGLHNSDTDSDGVASNKSSDNGVINSQSGENGSSNSQTSSNGVSNSQAIDNSSDNNTTNGYSNNANDLLVVRAYVCGAVVSPGVYYFREGAIKEEALQAAGGFQDEAAVEYINLAEEITNGERIYFPYISEIGTNILINNNQSASDDGGKININLATMEELLEVPGVGESKATAIINYRESNGPFSSIEEIMNIDGIKEGIFNKMKDFISIN